MEAPKDDGIALRETAGDVQVEPHPDAVGDWVEPALFDLHALVDRSAERFSATAQQKGIALEVKLAATVPSPAIGDAAHLEQVLDGLLENAVKFTDHGEVVASLTSQPTSGRRTLLYAEVSDTGTGIPAETMMRLFEGPRRSWAPTAAAGESGGLPTACRLVELMDGQLGASSALGMGTTIWFTVPLDLPAP